MKEDKYCIIKILLLENGIQQNVILVDSLSEIIELNEKKAQELADIFQLNSDWDSYQNHLHLLQ